ncbi:hypothetical protein DIPPA_07930 [Diplonema papillatum]|nr:hypothetical protein DIPPA_07930 [Diplonema papillatum]
MVPWRVWVVAAVIVFASVPLLVVPPGWGDVRAESYVPHDEAKADGSGRGEGAADSAHTSDAAVLDRINATLRAGSTDPPQTVLPYFGLVVTSEDADQARNLFNTLDVGVTRYHIVFNGNGHANPTAGLFAEAHRRFGDRFHFTHNPENAGKAAAWNEVARQGFGAHNAAFVTLSGCGIYPQAGSLAGYVAWVREGVEACGTVHHTAWDMFSLTRKGWDTLGTFDENLYPSDGEGLEYEARAHAAGVVTCRSRQYPSTPAASPAAKGGEREKLRGMERRHQKGGRYLLEKWGLRPSPEAAAPLPFAHPFNNERIPVKDCWVLDPAYRFCVQTGRGAEAPEQGCRVKTQPIIAGLLAKAVPPAAPPVAAVPPTSLGGAVKDVSNNDQLLHAIELLLAEGAANPSSSIPVFGMMATPTDADLARNLLAKLDVGVTAFHVIFNGVDRTGKMTGLLAEAQKRFGAQFYYTHNEKNAGVSVGWNQMITRGFETRNAAFVVLGDADLHPHPGHLRTYVDHVYSKGLLPESACGIVSYTEWALFALTKLGYDTLGTFDENLWPAYGEDIEYLVRMQAAHLNMCVVPGPPLRFTHVGSPNFKRDRVVQGMVGRHRNGQPYLQVKWHFDLFKRPTPIVGHYMHPFNDSRIPIRNGWIFDPAYRSCVETGQGKMIPGTRFCEWNAKDLVPKLVAASELAAAGGGFVAVPRAVTPPPPPPAAAVPSLPPPPPTDEHQAVVARIGALLSRAAAEPNPAKKIPFFGLMVTATDARLAKKLLEAIDVGVSFFYLIFNGPDATGAMTPALEAARDAWGPSKIAYKHNVVNSGVSVGWNLMAEHGFNHMKLDFVVIGNADLVPHPGVLARYLQYANAGNIQKCAVVSLHEWAFYGLTRRGFDTLGFFDENLWPAYGEDIEYIIRGQAAGLQYCDAPNMTFTHEGSPNFKRDRQVAAMVHRHNNGQAYLMTKWGFDVHKRPKNGQWSIVKHFMHPFNDARIPIKNCWTVDPEYRQCVQTGKGLTRTVRYCAFNRQLADKLIPEIAD